MEPFGLLSIGGNYPELKYRLGVTICNELRLGKVSSKTEFFPEVVSSYSKVNSPSYYPSAQCSKFTELYTHVPRHCELCFAGKLDDPGTSIGGLAIFDQVHLRWQGRTLR